MGIKTLDERHKYLAEQLIRGTPRSKIAEQLGVHRGTLYEWMKDPLWQEYFQKLASDLDEARGMRLLVTVLKAAEVAELYLDHVISELKTGDRDRIAELPSLDVISTALKRIVELERLDSGQPTSIARSEKTKTAEAPKGRSKEVTKVLDDLLARREESTH